MDDQQILTSGEYGGKPKFDFDRGSSRSSSLATPCYQTNSPVYSDIKTSQSPFLFLAIDLPAPPLFQDSVEKNIIPQVPLSVILSKYNGTTTQEVKGSILRRYKITSMPDFLILHIKRFTKNNFVEEKNPTIVNFPLRGVDMKDCKESFPPLRQESDSIGPFPPCRSTTRYGSNHPHLIILRSNQQHHSILSRYLGPRRNLMEDSSSLTSASGC